ncbi:MAG: PIG-L family deacetylase [Candidatus Omnitrophota bacterium]|jgi:LmbE family N-acetylglucosaminyl deacetylase
MILKDYSTILTLFAHPDDETLAAGATIKKLTRLGAEVHVAIPATGIHGRRNAASLKSRKAALSALRKDCQKACAVLGVSKEHIYLGKFADNEMDKSSLLEIVHWMEAIIARVKPDLILTHHRYCTNIDHQYCHNAVVVAARPAADAHISVLCGEVPSSTGYLRPAQWEPNVYVEVSEADLTAKINSMQTYKGEARLDPHPRSPEVLRALAKVRGSESGYLFAEAFMALRIFG